MDSRPNPRDDRPVDAVGAVTRLRAAVAAGGLNVTGTADPAAWDAAMPASRRTDALLPGARSILVFGNGGSALWDALVADLRRDPRGLTEQLHPLDAYVRRVVAAADPLLGDVPRRWFWATAEAELHVDFRMLAALGGMGVQSKLGLLLHPEWGTWLGLRAACFLAADLPASAPLTHEPCISCHAPCITACVGSAFVDSRWDVDTCARFHREADACERTCASRLACPEGAAHRYAPAHYAYHSHRRSGRALLREAIGLPPGADPHEGVGPHWGDWRARVDVKGP
jgi:epoxyqueuosine reductase QueG